MIKKEVIENSPTVPQAILDRCMIRHYTNDLISDEDLNTIIELAGRAPSSRNVQPWRVLAVQDKEHLKKLQSVSFDQPQVGSSAVTLIVYSDMKDMLEHADECVHPNFQGEERKEHIRAIINDHKNKTEQERETWGVGQAYIFLGYLQLAIEALGYGSSTMLGFIPGKVKEMFDLPNHVQIASLVSIGRPAKEGYKTHRHSVERILKFSKSR